MQQATFDKLREIVYTSSGIALPPSKRALLTARTGKRMRALGITDHELYLTILESDTSGDELVHLLDAVSTNVTSFFREPSHFDSIADVLRERVADGARRLRLWSAACSSGEEPYSLAMTVLEATRGTTVDTRILASDISTSALDKARAGQYPLEKARSIPATWRQRYGSRCGDRHTQFWQAGPELRNMVTFRRLNLSQPPLPMPGPLDVIMCRNVMIYFDLPVRDALLADINRLLHPDGLLVVGHAESLAAHMGMFTLVRPSVFRKKESRR